MMQTSFTWDKYLLHVLADVAYILYNQWLLYNKCYFLEKFIESMVTKMSCDNKFEIALR